MLIPSGAPHRVITAGRGRQRGTAETVGDAFATTRSERGGTAVIDLFCGHYTFDAGAGAMLFRSLPDPVHVSFGQSAESDEVLRMLSVLMRGEARREGEGTAAILSALCTALLAMVLRTSRGATTATTLWTAAATHTSRTPSTPYWGTPEPTGRSTDSVAWPACPARRSCGISARRRG